MVPELGCGAQRLAGVWLGDRGTGAWRDPGLHLGAGKEQVMQGEETLPPPRPLPEVTPGMCPGPWVQRRRTDQPIRRLQGWLAPPTPTGEGDARFSYPAPMKKIGAIRSRGRFQTRVSRPGLGEARRGACPGRRLVCRHSGHLCLVPVRGNGRARPPPRPAPL